MGLLLLLGCGEAGTDATTDGGLPDLGRSDLGADAGQGDASAGDVEGSDAGAGAVHFRFAFAGGDEGFSAGFADLPAPGPGIDHGIYEMEARVAPLPPELGRAETGYFIQGTNRSDDLFMFLARRVTGLEAGRRYRLDAAVVLASEAPSDCVGAGGAPGEAVWVKVGAVGREPRVAVPPGDDHLRLDVDKGDQSNGGSEMFVLGDVANGIPCGSEPPRFVSLTRTGRQTHEVTTSGAGELWLLVGTDSGYESTTRLYYESLEVVLTPAP